MIEARSAIINGYRDTEGNHALARIDYAMSGCGAQIKLVNMGNCGAYWLCRRADDPRNDYILLLPSDRWKNDARDDGFELIQKLNQRTEMTISKPGIYEIPCEDYHRDPAPAPSLSSSIAKLLVSRSARHAFMAHPRLGGAKADGDEESADPNASKAKALGELIHRLMLGKGAEIVVIDADSWRTNAAKAERDAALAAGKLAVLAHKLPEAQAAADAARLQLDDMCLEHVFRLGQKEAVIVWQEDGVWCRAMADNLIIDEASQMAELWDIKSVGRSSHPEACAKQISDLGYDLSLEFHARGLAAVRPDLAGRIKKRWVFVETKPPYAATPVEINGEWELAAQHNCKRALDIWRKCTTENRWPFYADSIVRLEPKPWLLADAFLTGETS